MKYKLAIFDFDGTLANSFPWFLSVLNELAAKYQFRSIRDDEVEILRTYDSRQIIAHLKVPLWKIPLIAREMRKQMAKSIERISLFPETGLMLESLAAKGISLAIVTSNSEANVRAVLGEKNANLIRYYACDTNLFGKSAKIKKVLRQSNNDASQTICIGDEVRDLNSARALSIDFGAVAWGYADLCALASHQPEEIFYKMSDIAERLTV